MSNLFMFRVVVLMFNGCLDKDRIITGEKRDFFLFFLDSKTDEEFFFYLCRN